MFNNALIYRIGSWEPPSRDDIDSRLDAGRFVECGASQLESVGWVEPRNEKNGVLMEGVGRQLILKLCVERKAVPSSVVKTQLEQRLEKIEADTGRRPKGKQARELKEDIVHGLLPRAFPKRSTTLVWIDPEARFIVLGTGSVKAADRMVSLLVELLGGGVTLTLLQSQLSPATAMAEWLTTRESPAGFTIDRECELKQPDSEKSTVRYARHTLDIDEVGEHIAQGKLPTQLAMTWNSRVSFVLNEAMVLKKIKLLDVVLEGTSKGPDGGFDTDVALITGELGQLIPELVEALGGELDRSQPVQQIQAPEVAQAA
ncbi:MAG: recombination-associated protein RdgC [Pseudomonadota bacterium]